MDVGVALADRMRAVLLIVPVTGSLMVLSLFMAGITRLLLLVAAVVAIYPLAMTARSMSRRRWGNAIGTFGNCILYDKGFYVNIAKGLDLFVEWSDISKWEPMDNGGSLIVTTDGTEIETQLPSSELEKILKRNPKDINSS